MRFWEAPLHVFGYAFDEVAAVFYERYPNSQAKHVLSEDVLSREISADRIITRKLIVKKGANFLQSVPKWMLARMSTVQHVQFMPTIEESVYDRRSGTLTSYTRNASWASVLQMDEKCVYSAVKGDANRTELTRRLFVDVNYGYISALLERLLVTKFRQSVKKTCDGYHEKLHERFGSTEADAVASAKEPCDVKKIIKQKFERLLDKAER